MAKLYPPHIEGALPAFCGTGLRIPFTGSRAVSMNDVSSMMAYVKDIQLGDIKERWKIPLAAVSSISNNTYEIRVNVTTGNLNSGEYYKLQLAYVDNAGTVGYFSDVGIIKYIKTPKISIRDGGGNHRYHYVADYSCADPTEKLYSTQFLLRKTDGTPIAASDEIIHDTRTDPTSTTAFESYDFLQELNRDDSYILQVAAQTTGGYKLYSPEYNINAAPSIPLSMTWGFDAQMDYDNGCVNLICKPGSQVTFTSNLKLVRADEKENYSIWHVMNEGLISVDMSDGEKILWKDFTVEQGQNYLYAVFQTDGDKKVSSKQYAGVVYADYEDSFLFDGERQLKIRFNPKVSSFKTTVQEAKVDTIGGKYPVIQRNGYTYYKEFPISGLISHLSDSDGYFNTTIAQLRNNAEEFEYTRPYSTNLNSENIAIERVFKTQVLAWLNDGKPKLFRSPTEGMFLVRIINTSLSPTDTVGRMLHSFSATAYEIDECTPEILRTKYNILRDQNLKGITRVEAEKGQIAYPLNLLITDGYDLIQNKTELKNNKITGATFICSPQPTGTLNVKINGTEINVLSSSVREEVITSLTKGSGFNPFSTDRVIFNYEGVQSVQGLPGKVGDLSSGQETGIFYNFDWTKLVGKIKKFFDYIYSLVCSPRGILNVVINGITSLIEAGYNTLKAIKESIIDQHGCCLASIIYAIKDAQGHILGYFDGSTCEIVKDLAGRIITTAPRACLSFWENIVSNGINTLKEIPNYLSGEKTFTLQDAPSALQNITANAFTCVRVLCQTVTAEIQTWASSEPLSSKDTYVGSGICPILETAFGVNLTSDNTISQGLALTNNDIYDTLINGFQQGTMFVTNAINNYVNSDEIINQDILIGVGDTLASAAQNLLRGSGVSTAITKISSGLFSGLFSASQGLFGGGC